MSGELTKAHAGGSSTSMSGSSSWYVITFTSLVAIGIVVVEMLLVCHMIKQNHVIQGSSDYNNKRPLS